MAAQTIVNGVTKGHARVVIGWEAKAFDVLARVIGPSLSADHCRDGGAILPVGEVTGPLNGLTLRLLSCGGS